MNQFDSVPQTGGGEQPRRLNHKYPVHPVALGFALLAIVVSMVWLFAEVPDGVGSLDLVSQKTGGLGAIFIVSYLFAWPFLWFNRKTRIISSTAFLLIFGFGLITAISGFDRVSRAARAAQVENATRNVEATMGDIVREGNYSAESVDKLATAFDQIATSSAVSALDAAAAKFGSDYVREIAARGQKYEELVVELPDISGAQDAEVFAGASEKLSAAREHLVEYRRYVDRIPIAFRARIAEAGADQATVSNYGRAFDRGSKPGLDFIRRTIRIELLTIEQLARIYPILEEHAGHFKLDEVEEVFTFDDTVPEESEAIFWEALEKIQALEAESEEIQRKHQEYLQRSLSQQR